MNTNQRARAFAIEIEIANVEFMARAIKLCLITRINRAGQSKLSIVRDAQRIVVIIGFNHSEHWSKNFFLLDCRTGFRVRDNSRFNEVALFAIRTSASDHSAAFGFALFNVIVN